MSRHIDLLLWFNYELAAIRELGNSVMSFYSKFSLVWGADYKAQAGIDTKW